MTNDTIAITVLNAIRDWLRGRYDYYQCGHYLIAMPGVRLCVGCDVELAILELWRIGFTIGAVENTMKARGQLHRLVSADLCAEDCFEIIYAGIQRHATVADDVKTAAKALRYELSKAAIPPKVIAHGNNVVVKKWPPHKRFPFDLSTGWMGFKVTIEYAH